MDTAHGRQDTLHAVAGLGCGKAHRIAAGITLRLVTGDVAVAQVDGIRGTGSVADDDTVFEGRHKRVGDSGSRELGRDAFRALHEHDIDAEG